MVCLTRVRLNLILTDNYVSAPLTLDPFTGERPVDFAEDIELTVVIRFVKEAKILANEAERR